MTESKETDSHMGTCALCDHRNVVLKESHSIPKFVYQWVKITSRTPYLRFNDNVNVREQDGPKEYLLCGDCEQHLSTMEAELAEQLFKKIANYRTQAQTIPITESMRTGILSIFWRTLLTSAKRSHDRTPEDQALVREFLASAKDQIKKVDVTTPIYIAPFHGEPPFFELPQQLTYLLDRMVGAPDIRFFDAPHRYFAVFKLPFMFFYIASDGWSKQLDPNAEFVGTLTPAKIRSIPDFLRYYILNLEEQFKAADASMSQESREQIGQDASKCARMMGSDKSATRSRASELTVARDHVSNAQRKLSENEQDLPQLHSGDCALRAKP
jgi:hypothetical protein